MYAIAAASLSLFGLKSLKKNKSGRDFDFITYYRHSEMAQPIRAWKQSKSNSFLALAITIAFDCPLPSALLQHGPRETKKKWCSLLLSSQFLWIVKTIQPTFWKCICWWALERNKSNVNSFDRRIHCGGSWCTAGSAFKDMISWNGNLPSPNIPKTKYHEWQHFEIFV